MHPRGLAVGGILAVSKLAAVEAFFGGERGKQIPVTYFVPMLKVGD